MTEFLDWDEASRPVLRPARTFIPRRPVDTWEITAAGASQPAQPTSDEATPLLKASPTSSNQVSHEGSDLDAYVGEESRDPTDRSLLRRKSSVTLKKPHNYGGQSTYGQTVGVVIWSKMFLLSAVNRSVIQQYRDIIGYRNAIRAPGLCICRLDRRNSSYCIYGLPELLYVSYTLALFNYVLPLTAYNSAKILARIILEDPRLRSYADIGRKAFGPKSTALTTIMFCLELFAVGSACFLNDTWSHCFDVSLVLLS
jgi:vesicular inhibitory amino acid transporter